MEQYLKETGIEVEVDRTLARIMNEAKDAKASIRDSVMRTLLQPDKIILPSAKELDFIRTYLVEAYARNDITRFRDPFSKPKAASPVQSTPTSTNRAHHGLEATVQGSPPSTDSPKRRRYQLSLAGEQMADQQHLSADNQRLLLKHGHIVRGLLEPKKGRHVTTEIVESPTISRALPASPTSSQLAATLSKPTNDQIKRVDYDLRQHQTDTRKIKMGHSSSGDDGKIQYRSLIADIKEEEENDYKILGSGVLLDGSTAMFSLHDMYNAHRFTQQDLGYIPSEGLRKLNMHHLFSKSCPTAHTPSKNPAPLPDGEWVVSPLTSLNWYSNHRLLGMAPDATGVNVRASSDLGWSGLFLHNRSANDTFVPLFPLTQELQVTLLDTYLGSMSKGQSMSDLEFSGRDKPVHIFVDVSNIVISWMALLKTQNGFRPQERIKQQPPFCFPNLHRILCRGRKPGPCFAIGSSSPGSKARHLEEAETICHYHVKDMPRLPRHGSSPPPSSLKKRKEHFVDETLHLHMGTSIMDHEPATMVVGTGDGNAAEYSQGFHTYILRALKRGWRVELVAFRSSINSAYLEPEFRKTWGDRFKIFELDTYADMLFAMWASN